MKLWKISQTVNRGYDTYDSAIVAANTAAEARMIHPADTGESWNAIYANWNGQTNPSQVWATADKVTVECIGTARPGTNKGVVLSSFNAG